MHSSSSSGDGTSSGERRFDASQYAFFGREIAEEQELGDLEEANDSFAPAVPDDQFHFSSVGDRELAETYASLSHIDDLSSIFARIDRAVSDPPRRTGIIGDRSSFSRDSSSTTEWMQETGSQNWFDPNLNDNNKMWWSNPLTESTAKPLLRTSSSPNNNPPHHHHPNFLNKPSPLTESNSQPLLRTASSPNQNPPPHNHHQSFLNPKPQIALPRSHHSANLTRHSSLQHSIYENLNLNLNSVGDLSNLSNFSNFPNFSPSQQGHLLNPSLSLNPNGLVFAQNQIYPPLSNYPNFNPSYNNFNRNSSNPRDQRVKNSSNKNKQKDRFAPDTNLQRNDSNNSSTLPQFRSKYMSSEEIQNIHKIQHNVSHNNTNPYIVDYYHQASIFKKGVKCQFYPSSLKDVTNTNPKSRASTEKLSFLPTIRNPKPLLQTETKNKFVNKPLERETMFAVRITIEDSLSILLDIDDIDRTIQLSVPSDGGYQLKKRRQILLEALASSLQLVDPLKPQKPNNPLDPLDQVFLKIVSIPKGRKLISRFLRLVPAGTDLSRVVCMAVFRHLRFLFGGGTHEDSETLITLAKTISNCVYNFELSGLSACLAAVVCSSEQPPLRPIGRSLGGDGASLALKSVLDKATELLSSKECGVSSRLLWQASFDAFFGLLSKYCMGKYESVAKMCFGNGDDVARAVGREMPVELLRASLPHTNEQQRRVLLDFAQRSMADPVHTS